MKGPCHGHRSEAYQRAKQRVDDLKGFYIHFMVYIVVITALLVIDLLSGDDWWFYWPMIGWGIGVAIHAGSHSWAGAGLAVSGNTAESASTWSGTAAPEAADRGTGPNPATNLRRAPTVTKPA